MRITLCLVAAALVSIDVAAQTLGKLAADNFINEVASNKRQYYNDPVNPVQGSPFLLNDFVQGSILVGKVKYDSIPLRFNIFEDKIEFLYRHNIYALDPGNRIKKIVLGNYVILPYKVEYKFSNQYVFLVQLDSGRASLLVKREIVFKDRQEARAMDSGPTPASFVRAENIFYYLIGDGLIYRLRTLKEMIASFPDRQEELRKFVKKEKISAKNEGELIELIRYYNSL